MSICFSLYFVWSFLCIFQPFFLLTLYVSLYPPYTPLFPFLRVWLRPFGSHASLLQGRWKVWKFGGPKKSNIRSLEGKKSIAPMAVKIWVQALEKTPHPGPPGPPIPTALNIITCLDLKIMSLQKWIIHPKQVSTRQLSTLLQQLC